jgi:hypothetical protein
MLVALTADNETLVAETEKSIRPVTATPSTSAVADNEAAPRLVREVGAIAISATPVLTSVKAVKGSSVAIPELTKLKVTRRPPTGAPLTSLTVARATFAPPNDKLLTGRPARAIDNVTLPAVTGTVSPGAVPGVLPLEVMGEPPPHADSNKTTAKPPRYFIGFICIMSWSRK